MVREAGFEPAPGCPDPLLRRARLPFRHSRTFDYIISVRRCPLVYEGKRPVTSQTPATQAVAHLHEDAAQMVLPASVADAPSTRTGIIGRGASLFFPHRTRWKKKKTAPSHVRRDGLQPKDEQNA